jgi:transposase
MKDYRLPPEKLQLLRRRHRAIRDRKSADRLKAVYLLGSGWSVSDICTALLIDENTVYRYFKLYETDGIKGLLKKNYKGRDEQLTPAELSDLDSYLQEHPLRTTKQVIDYIEQEYGVTYSISGVNAFLKRLNYSYKKPCAVPGKSDLKAQQSFIKKYKRIRNNMRSEDSLFFMDGVHPQHNPLVQYGWFKKGSKQPLRTNTQYHRLHFNGAIDIDSLDVVSHCSTTLNEESTLDILEKLRKKRPSGRLNLVLDNAGYYNTKRVKLYAKSLGITLMYLPAYSPNLNLIERLWGFMQRDILYNHYYSTFDEFKKVCMDFFRQLPKRKKELRVLMTEKFQTLPA